VQLLWKEGRKKKRTHNPCQRWKRPTAGKKSKIKEKREGRFFRDSAQKKKKKSNTPGQGGLPACGRKAYEKRENDVRKRRVTRRGTRCWGKGL